MKNLIIDHFTRCTLSNWVYTCFSCDHRSTAHWKRTPVTLHNTRTLGFVCLCPLRVVWKKPESTFLFLFLREARILFSNIHLEERRQHSSRSLFNNLFFLEERRRQHSSRSLLTIYLFFKIIINILTIFFIFYKSIVKTFLK